MVYGHGWMHIEYQRFFREERNFKKFFDDSPSDVSYQDCIQSWGLGLRGILGKSLLSIRISVTNFFEKLIEDTSGAHDIISLEK
ncbi:hypothetical protein M5K25_021791 [Dendrobium thyrsiflorum]|uniref:Uncharacterized protein n=1 Tax=Dendrobium thyrsiflorum TaxID=117978 RepID=A0ABD0U4Y9_DENTH